MTKGAAGLAPRCGLLTRSFHPALPRSLFIRRAIVPSGFTSSICCGGPASAACVHSLQSSRRPAGKPWPEPLIEADRDCWTGPLSSRYRSGSHTARQYCHPMINDNVSVVACHNIQRVGEDGQTDFGGAHTGVPARALQRWKKRLACPQALRSNADSPVNDLDWERIGQHGCRVSGVLSGRRQTGER
jgi:hypothetical protein